jgi:hypothetical protein
VSRNRKRQDIPAAAKPAPATTGTDDADADGIRAAGLLRLAAQHGWTSARRRAMADVLTGELTNLQHPPDNIDPGEPASERPAAPIAGMLTDADPSSPAVEHALTQAWALAATTRPPPGSIRITKAAGRARVVRATGHGWTLLARTDGPVVLLLDRGPGAALQVGADATHLSGLLNALTAAAARAPT